MLLPALLQAQLRGQSSFLEENQKIPPSHFPKSKIRGTQLTGSQSYTATHSPGRTGPALLFGELRTNPPPSTLFS